MGVADKGGQADQRLSSATIFSSFIFIKNRGGLRVPVRVFLHLRISGNTSGMSVASSSPRSEAHDDNAQDKGYSPRSHSAPESGEARRSRRRQGTCPICSGNAMDDIISHIRLQHQGGKDLSQAQVQGLGMLRCGHPEGEQGDRRGGGEQGAGHRQSPDVWDAAFRTEDCDGWAKRHS